MSDVFFHRKKKIQNENDKNSIKYFDSKEKLGHSTGISFTENPRINGNRKSNLSFLIGFSSVIRFMKSEMDIKC